MNEKQRNKRVIWAVDAFPDSMNVQVQAGRSAGLVIKRWNAEVEPVYVYKPDPPGLFIQETPDAEHPWLDTARKNLKVVEEYADFPNGGEVKLLASMGYSVRSMVNALLDYATQTRCDLIVVGSHSRKGIPRLFMGSFAETLVLQSAIPVLVANQSGNVPKASELKQLVFPTDFSEASHQAFLRTIDLARELRAEILLLHQIELFRLSLPYPAVMPAVGKEAVEALVAENKEKGMNWIAEAEKLGVKAALNLVRKMDDVATVIVKTARKTKGACIVMSSHTGKWETQVLGSLTRKVLRQANCPVWVLPTPAPKKTRTESGRPLLS